MRGGNASVTPVGRHCFQALRLEQDPAVFCNRGPYRSSAHSGSSTCSWRNKDRGAVWHVPLSHFACLPQQSERHKSGICMCISPLWIGFKLRLWPHEALVCMQATNKWMKSIGRPSAVEEFGDGRNHSLASEGDLAPPTSTSHQYTSSNGQATTSHQRFYSTSMVFSAHVQSQLFGIPSGTDATIPDEKESRLIRLPLTQQGKMKPSRRRSGIPWTTAEHDRFLDALEVYPTGPWKAIAEYVGTRTPRQTMTHAQKYRQKIERSHRVNRVSDARKMKLEHRHNAMAQASLSPTAVDATVELDHEVPYVSTSSRSTTGKAIETESADSTSHEPIDCFSMTEDMLDDLLNDESVAMLLNDMVSCMPVRHDVYSTKPTDCSAYEAQGSWETMCIEW